MEKKHPVIKALEYALSDTPIITGESLKPYCINCLSLARQIIAAIKPKEEKEIVTVVEIAQKYRTPIYAISTGHNWGYGTSIPVVDDCIIVDLSLMNRILHFDHELGLITLEPGVTQQQLVNFLKENKYDYYTPTTGAGPTMSVVGNALERGFGITPDEDHYRAVTSLRAVMADGSIFQSCLQEMGANLAGVWRWGLGPYLDGLFSQGNIGIVSALQIALVSRPEHTEVFLFSLREDATFDALSEACHKLLVELRGPIGGIKILNRQQLEHTIGAGKTVINFTGNYEWMGVGVFRCRKGMVNSLRKEIKRLLKPSSALLLFINQRRIGIAEKILQWLPRRLADRLSNQVHRAKDLMEIVNGNPREMELRLVYHFVPVPENSPIDPIRDGVGIIWYAPILPLKPSLMKAMVEMIEITLSDFGYPPTISFTTINERCAIGVIPIVYKKNEGHIDAHRCFHELWRKGDELGCPPYRLNVEAMEKLTSSEHSVFWKSAAAIKRALDPEDIISPGRYCPTDRPRKPIS